jgi:hypothetical protein
MLSWLVSAARPKGERREAFGYRSALSAIGAGDPPPIGPHKQRFPPNSYQRFIGAANAIAKIERASQAAMSSYFRLKHGSTQTIRVEKIEIQPGAQAVVGQVSASV